MSHQLMQVGSNPTGKKKKKHFSLWLLSGLTEIYRPPTAAGCRKKCRKVAPNHATNIPPDDGPASSHICWAESSI